jgi:hypothetical protein
MLNHTDLKVIGEELIAESKAKIALPLKKKYASLGCMYLMKYAIGVPNMNQEEKSSAFMKCSMEAFKSKETDLAKTLAKEGLRHQPSQETKFKLNNIIRSCDDPARKKSSAV